MSRTLPRPPHERHLSAITDGAADAAAAAHAASEHASGISQLAISCLAGRAARPQLNRAEALRLDQAELFLLSLDTEMLTADSLRAAYLLGLAEIHLAGLIEIVRAVAR